MDILKLPNEMLVEICRRVDWISLQNLQLVSKEFNEVIQKNLSTMKKPKVNSLWIVYKLNDNEEKINLQVYIIHEKKLKLKNCLTIKIGFTNLICNSMEIFEFYIERLNLSRMKLFCIHIKGQSRVVEIINKYIKYKIHVKRLILNIDQSPILTSLIELLSKLNYVKKLYISRLCFDHQNIRTDLKLSLPNSLKSLMIKECKCTKFINTPMIIEIIENNKNLKKISIISNTTSYKKKIVNIMKKRQKDNSENMCKHDNYSLSFIHQYDTIPAKEFVKFFSTGNVWRIKKFYNFSSLNDITATIIVAQTCSNCMKEMEIKLEFVKAIDKCFGGCSLNQLPLIPTQYLTN
uniref:F-box domain-containing protein n=1 Tax=Parastrongyloides trichosuri TaxID=131310 RepID=A0A0N4ZGC2_PARTI